MLNFFVFATWAMVLGYALDMLIGDPQGWPHVVRLFGWLIMRLEKRLYPRANKRQSGVLLVLLVLLIGAGLPALLLWLAWLISPWLYLALESLLCWQLLATRSLRDESLPVYEALMRHDLPGARRALSMIVGRDTASLSQAGVMRAAVETVAENTADGVAAPLLYIALGGAQLGCLYKAVNTMDSMVGYRNARYLDFGRCAARLDDVLNYLPARLCALLMIQATRPCGLNHRVAFRIWCRDRRKHASPNSGQTEAVMAGALGVQLGGNAWYKGKLVTKPTIGDDSRPIEPMDIRRAHKLLFATSLLLFLAALLIRGLVYGSL